MAEDDDILTTDDNKNPVSNYLSIVLTIIGLVMLLLIKHWALLPPMRPAGLLNLSCIFLSV